MPSSITWHGHANFQIRTPGCNIMVDPLFGGASAPAEILRGKDKPDLVLVTHLHGDHYQQQQAKG
jgi:L-ascorbate metabolism protein UlaG (beta-lactamase superfamily)